MNLMLNQLYTGTCLISFGIFCRPHRQQNVILVLFCSSEEHREESTSNTFEELFGNF